MSQALLLVYDGNKLPEGTLFVEGVLVYGKDRQGCAHRNGTVDGWVNVLVKVLVDWN